MARGNVVFVKRTISLMERATIETLYPERTMLLSYRHYGIEVGTNSVIHFQGENSFDFGSAYIKMSSLEKFLAGGKLETDVMVNPIFDADEIANRAHKMIGNNFGGFHLFDNNCEHFANWCATGNKISRQILFKEDDYSIAAKITDKITEPIERFIDKGDKFFGDGRYKGNGTIDKLDKHVEKIDDFIENFKSGWKGFFY